MPWFRTSRTAARAALVVTMLLVAAAPAAAEDLAQPPAPAPSEDMTPEPAPAEPVPAEPDQTEPAAAAPAADPTPAATVEPAPSPGVVQPTSVTPPRLARFSVRRQPARRIVYGTRSAVRTVLATTSGHALAGQRVELLARFRGSDTWRGVAAGRTSTSGAVTLRPRLAASAALRLHHPAGLVTAEDVRVRPVVVAKRISVRPSRTMSRAGSDVRIPGRVAPGQRVGSAVRLQRRVAGDWRPAATGRMTSRGRYLVRWRPGAVGEYTLRVRKSGDVARAAGTSRRWRHRVKPESSADIARDILRDRGITLSTSHLSAGRDGATARDNIVDAAHGRRARTSCVGSAPCGTTRLDRRLLLALRQMGRNRTLTISEIAGGSHAGRSAHYRGRALDITWINGRHVGYGTSYASTANVCRGYNAGQVFTPSSDPYGGHGNHVHCAWG